MKYAFIRDHKGVYPVRVLCKVLHASPSGFYRWCIDPISRLRLRRDRLLARIHAVHTASRATYGSPRVHSALTKEGDAPCVNTVAALMKAHGIRAKARRAFRPPTTTPRPIAAPDLVQGRFTADAPNRVWTADITYLRTGEGFLYLAGVMDLYSRRIVGWSMAAHLRQQLVLDALTMALRHRRPEKGLIHHSDRGSQYSARAYTRLLRRHGALASQSRSGNCYDNAPTESLWSTLKRELTGEGRVFRTRAEARTAVFQYIEVFYNRRRLHSVLNYRSPETFESESAQSPSAH